MEDNGSAKEYKLFIGRLAYAATENDLRQSFEEAGLLGSVVSIEVMMDRMTNRPRGFAFVRMADEGSMRQAIERLNGKEVLGRAISVDESRSREEGSQSGGNRGRGGSWGNRSGGGGGGYGRDNRGGGFRSGGGYRAA